MRSPPICDAAAGRAVEAADEIEQRGFAGAGRPHQREELALAPLRGRGRKDVDFLRAALEGFGDVADADEGFGVVLIGWISTLTAAPSVRWRAD